MQDIELLEVIGSGSYGDVYKAYDKKKKEYRAVKKFKHGYGSVKQCMKEPEVKVMTKLKHKNIVPLKKVIYEDNKLWLIMELCDKNLGELIDERRKQAKGFTEQEIKNYMRDIFAGVQALHSHGFLHRDLKPENILVSKDNSLKLTDFGTIKSLKDKAPYTNYVSTRWYRPPECILEVERYAESSDVFALGCIFAEFFTCKPVFCGTSSKDQLLKYCNVLGVDELKSWKEGNELAQKFWIENTRFHESNLSRVLPNAPHNAIMLIKKMLSLNPDNRPTIDDILSDVYFCHKTPSSNYSYSTNDSLEQEMIMNELKNMTENKIKPKNGFLAPDKSNVIKIDKKHIVAKDVIKQKLKNKLGQLNTLDLSNVVETDRESVGEESPMKCKSKPNFIKKSKFEIGDHQSLATERSSLNHLSSSIKTRDSSDPENSEKDYLSKCKNFNSQTGLHRYASHGQIVGQGITNKFNKYEVEKEVNFDDKSPLHYIPSQINFASSSKTNHLSSQDSSGDALETLRQQVDKKQTHSMPVSMKIVPNIEARYSSRGSVNFDHPAGSNNVDKYFTDLNGHSLLSTMNTSNEVFTSISSARRHSQRKSLISGSLTNRGYNVGSQIMFGSSAKHLPTYDLRSDGHSSRGSSVGQRQNHY